MLQPLGALFNNLPKQVGEVDVKYLVQDFLRGYLKSEAIYCDSIKNGSVVVRVATPGLQQAVKLLEFDLIEYLQEQADYNLESIKVRVE